MLNKPTARIIAALFALALFLSFDVSAASRDKKATARKTIASQTNCSKVTDEELVKTIREKLEADADFKDQMRHLNVSVKNRIVKLEGWLRNQTQIDKAVKLVRSTRCVRRVINKLRTRGGGTCGAGLKPCGDTCIEKDSECTIGSGKVG